ncbi:MAG TPA: aminotransferase class V-fold PLP-dependent enzyme [Saprospiraceae bacterium]|nr:aminotransferase class V-fold PLP-dependent enzyme [Saprospiraceae bacterium]
MNKRRSFLKKASMGLLGVHTLPLFSSRQKEISFADFARAKNDDTLFRLVRESLLLPEDMVYLNTGSLGPSPRQVVDEVSAALHELEKNPVINNWGPLGQKMEAVRSQIAEFIGASEAEIILTRNTTEGINLLGTCLEVKPGDEILTTHHEHGGGENGLFYLAETQGAIVKKVDLPLPATSTRQIVDLIQAGITARTKVLMLSHVSTITGLRMPFWEIAKLTRPRGILLVADGAQAPGQLSINVEALGVDLYASSGHKWLLGPKETGFLYLRKELQERLQPVFTRGSNKAYSAASGTRNVATIIGLGAVIQLHQIIGPEKIEQRCTDLARYCRAQLSELEGIQVISPSDPELCTGIVSVSLDEKFSNRAIFQKMKEKNIIIKVLPKYNALRFSMHLFTSEMDIDKMVDHLKRLL